MTKFGRNPNLVAKAPGRVNLIGEHTDYNGGFVLPLAIDRAAVIAAAISNRDHSTLIALELDEVVHADLRGVIQPVANLWANHLLGVAAQFKSRGFDLPQIDLVLASDIPIGAGLAGSAAIEVAMATLLDHLCKANLDAIAKAKLCQRAEHEFVDTPCGLMDMLVSIAARADHALLIDCASNELREVSWLGDDLTLLVVNSGVRHELAGSEYAARRSTCEAAAVKLGLPSLRDATLEMLSTETLSNAERRCASHVVTENTRTLLAASALLQHDFDTLGQLMLDSHRSLRELYDVSCAELDAIVDAAAELRDAGAVFGARMTGGGFGGCAIVLCRPAEATMVREFVTARFAERFDRRPEIFNVRAVGGATMIHQPADTC